MTKLLRSLSERIEKEIATSLCEACLDFGNPDDAKAKIDFASHVQTIFKRGMDIVFSVIFLIISLPLFVILAIAIKLTSRGDVFFKQKRVGYLGKKFTILKFRTMYQEPENTEHKEIVQNIIKSGDSKQDETRMLIDFINYIEKRTTPLGKFLRSSSLDELPQLINIFLGQMSLVGPRPHPVYEVEGYKKWYHRRLCVKPGLTGWSKLNLRLTPQNYEEAILYDLWYVDHLSIKMDIQIILMTIPFVLSSKDAH